MGQLGQVLLHITQEAFSPLRNKRGFRRTNQGGRVNGGAYQRPHDLTAGQQEPFGAATAAATADAAGRPSKRRAAGDGGTGDDAAAGDAAAASLAQVARAWA